MTLREEVAYNAGVIDEGLHLMPGVKAEIVKQHKAWADKYGIELSDEAFNALVDIEVKDLEGIELHKDRPITKLLNWAKRHV